MPFAAILMLQAVIICRCLPLKGKYQLVKRGMLLSLSNASRVHLCREEWARFSESVTAAERAAQLAEGGFAFAFKEGALVKALRQGHWVLLDEINLAPSEASYRASTAHITNIMQACTR